MATRSALSRVAPALLKARPYALSSKVSRAAFLAARNYASEAGHSVSPFCPTIRRKLSGTKMDPRTRR